jgi:hypothetical protein
MKKEDLYIMYRQFGSCSSALIIIHCCCWQADEASMIQELFLEHLCFYGDIVIWNCCETIGSKPFLCGTRYCSELRVLLVQGDVCTPRCAFRIPHATKEGLYCTTVPTGSTSIRPCSVSSIPVCPQIGTSDVDSHKASSIRIPVYVIPVYLKWESDPG